MSHAERKDVYMFAHRLREPPQSATQEPLTLGLRDAIRSLADYWAGGRGSRGTFHCGSGDSMARMETGSERADGGSEGAHGTTSGTQPGVFGGDPTGDADATRCDQRSHEVERLLGQFRGNIGQLNEATDELERLIQQIARSAKQ